MAEPQGLFSFPGILRPKSGECTISHGVQPGRILLRAAYQVTPPAEIGDLTITYGANRFAIPDCKVVNIRSTNGDDGLETEYEIEDHRWRWRCGEIEGHYNERLEDGSIRPDSLRLMDELAELLLKAMKTPRYSLAGLPNNVFPEVLWLSTNPALELERLVSEVGLRVVYDPIDHITRFEKGGNGALLPQRLSYVSGNSALIAPGKPSAIRVVGDVTRVETRLLLKAVGQEPDGEIKDLADLKYKPTNGWDFFAENEMVNVTNEAAKKSYQNSVLKWYQVDLETRPITVNADGFQFVVNDLDKLEELSLELNEKRIDPDGGQNTLEGWVEGIFYDSIFDPNDGVPINTSLLNNNVRYKRGFSLDSDQKLVKFSERVFKVADGATATSFDFEPATLELLCTFSLRNAGRTNSLHRFSYFVQSTGDPAKIGPKVVLAEDLKWKVTDQNKSDENNSAYSLPPSWSTNRFDDDLDQESLARANAELQKYDQKQTGDAYYAELFPVRLDGAIQNVTWRFSARGAFTEIYRNTEPDYIQTKYARRFQFNQIRRRLNLP